jgi:hypothetical protein
MEPFSKKVSGSLYICMRKAIGFLIILWGLSTFLQSTFSALDAAATQSFKTVETAARVAEVRLIEL